MMTFGDYLHYLEFDFAEKTNAFLIADPEEDPRYFYFYDQQLSDFECKKSEWQTAKKRYYCFKLLIYQNNIELDQKISMQLIEEYESRYPQLANVMNMRLCV